MFVIIAVLAASLLIGAVLLGIFRTNKGKHSPGEARGDRDNSQST